MRQPVLQHRCCGLKVLHQQDFQTYTSMWQTVLQSAVLHSRTYKRFLDLPEILFLKITVKIFRPGRGRFLLPPLTRGAMYNG
jgi:hypothetical protein